MDQFFQQILNWLTVGSVYALIALGYTMVYGIMKLINFAHGEVFMIGAYTTFVGMVYLKLPFLASLLLAMVFAGLLGFVIERVAYKPLRKSSRISALITAIGMSLLLQNIVIKIFGADVLTLPEVSVFPSLTFGNVVINGNQLLIFVVTIILLVILQYIVYHTQIGRAMRAASIDYEAASLMGINVDFVVSFTFVLGSILAAGAGSLVAAYYNSLSPAMGVSRGLKAFIAAVFGGIGILPGAVIGGFLIGGIETLVSLIGLSLWREAAVYFVLIIILLVKPSGILGKKGGTKV
ncbi:ABC transporter permease [Erysipelothrix larvae]|uniref:ABC transporter permease n=1 Tax=Erysipelothrix larvae TaxID=1514105 RepID=A0A109UGZ2_9FIRM|nr:branched-chain amino acid ABC transporter permease [Erysipelothrix larvae]AMC93406.1 ABC transporter permease [Erysipelothrix larvae]